MGCGCKAKKAQRAAQQAARLAAAEAMPQEEAETLVPLGLKAGVSLPAQVPRAVGNRTLVIAEGNDRRDFLAQNPAMVVRGRNARVPAKLRQQLIARYPGLFEEEVKGVAIEPEPA